MNRHDTWYSQITRVQYMCPLPRVLYTCYTSFSVLSYWRNRKSKCFPWQYLLIKHSSFRILTDITCPIHVSLATCICHVSYVFFYFIEGMENQNLFLGNIFNQTLFIPNTHRYHVSKASVLCHVSYWRNGKP